MNPSRRKGVKYLVSSASWLLLFTVIANIENCSGEASSTIGSPLRASKMFASFSLHNIHGPVPEGVREKKENIYPSSAEGDESHHQTIPSDIKGSIDRYFEQPNDNEANESNDSESFVASGSGGDGSSSYNDGGAYRNEREDSNVKSNGHQINHDTYQSDDTLNRDARDINNNNRPTYTMGSKINFDSHLQSDESLTHLQKSSKLWSPSYDHRASRDHLNEPSNVNVHTLLDPLGDETTNRAKYLSAGGMQPILHPTRQSSRDSSSVQRPQTDFGETIGANKQLNHKDQSTGANKYHLSRSVGQLIKEGRKSIPIHSMSASPRQHSTGSQSKPSIDNDDSRGVLPSDDHTGQSENSDKQEDKQNFNNNAYPVNGDDNSYRQRSNPPEKHYHNQGNQFKFTPSDSNYRMVDTPKVNDALAQEEAKTESDIYFDDTPNTNGYHGQEAASSRQRSEEDEKETKSPFDFTPYKEDADGSMELFSDSRDPKRLQGTSSAFVTGEVDKGLAASIRSSASHVMDFSPPMRPGKRDSLIAEPSQHNRHGGGDQHGWLDMGAYSGKHGAFGWYADFPVGGAAGAAAHPYAASSRQHSHHQPHPSDYHSPHSIG